MTMLKTVCVCLAAVPLAAATAATSQWFGTWKLKLSDPSEPPETLVYSDAGSGAMRMVSVEQKSVIVTRMDGVPAADIGTKDGGGRTLAVKAVSPTRYRWTFAVGGKTIAEGVNTLSDDRRTFEEVSWSPAKPDKRITLIYERQ